MKGRSSPHFGIFLLFHESKALNTTSTAWSSPGAGAGSRALLRGSREIIHRRAAAAQSLRWQREAIDWPVLPRLTRALVGRRRHSRLSPDGIYYVLCFNVCSARVEINFSLGPNCLCALAAEGRPAPSRRSPRHIAQLYFKPNYTRPRPPARTDGLWGVIPQRMGLTVNVSPPHPPGVLRYVLLVCVNFEPSWNRFQFAPFCLRQGKQNTVLIWSPLLTYYVLSQYAKSAKCFLSMCLHLAMFYLVDVLFFLHQAVYNIMAQGWKLAFGLNSGVFTLLFCSIRMPCPLIK